MNGAECNVSFPELKVDPSGSAHPNGETLLPVAGFVYCFWVFFGVCLCARGVPYCFLLPELADPTCPSSPKKCKTHKKVSLTGTS